MRVKSRVQDLLAWLGLGVEWAAGLDGDGEMDERDPGGHGCGEVKSQQGRVADVQED